jgi:hypothetical protein
MPNPLENGFPSQEVSSQTPEMLLSWLVNLLAFVLILSGLFVLMFLLREVYLAYQQPDASAFFLYVTRGITNKVLFSQEGLSPYVIGEGSATIIALVVFILFLSMIFSAATGLIRAGIDIIKLRR